MTQRKESQRKRTRMSRCLFALSLTALAFGLIHLGWGVWPAPNDGVGISIPAGVLPGAPLGTTYASMADYTLNVSWQKRIRLGESGKLSVSLSEAEADTDAALDRPAQVVLVEPAFTGVTLAPAGSVQANLAAGQELTLTWEVEEAETGDYTGKVYVSFGFYDDALGELVSVPVAVVDAAIRVTALWGLEGRLALWLGLVGVALWGALFLLGRAVEGG